MEVFNYGTIVKVKATNRVGIVTDFSKSKITVEFYDKDYYIPDTKEYKMSEVETAELKPIKPLQLRKFIRGEIFFDTLTDNTNILPEQLEGNEYEYTLNAKDLLCGINAYEGLPIFELTKWIDTLFNFECQISFGDEPDRLITDKVTEEDILNLAYSDLIYRHDYTVDSLRKIAFGEVKDYLTQWVESSGKTIPGQIIKKVARQFDCDSIDKQSKATQKLFKKCLDTLCDEKDPKALQRRGYCYYCGTDIYPNDWYKAREAFIEYYQLTGDASAANTLGYIYYYGRCNGGVPQYEEAFKYFSIGHAYTYFESTYKLADMFAHGYGVVKDGETANHLYWSVYEQNIERFRNGDFACKFADAALRMGNCFRYEIGADKDLETAYFYYLQADLAIRKRVEAYNHYGDSVVFNGIQKALMEVRQEYTDKGKTIKFRYPGWTEWTLIDHRRCRLRIKELKNGVISLSALPIKRRHEKTAPQMLITVPQADYCELRKNIKIHTSKDSSYCVTDGSNEIIFDSCDFDNRNGKTSFYLGDDLTGVIITNYYYMTVNTPKEIEPEGELYHFASVLFEESKRTYDYLCDDVTVKAGDRVIIKGYDGEKEVLVVSTFDRYENQLGLPLERYKKIIRKAEPD